MASPYGAVLTIMLALAGSPQDPAGLVELIATAREENPRIMAARLQADAARERVSPAGALPDPVLSLGLMNRSLADPGRSDIQMTSDQVMLSQRFPWRGRRGLTRTGMEARAAAEAANAREIEAAVVTRVRELYYELAYLERAVATSQETRDLLRGFREVSEGLYAVGDAIQADVLQAQISVAGTTGDLMLLEERRVATAARLNALLGRSPESVLPAPELPAISGELPNLGALMERASRDRPALAAARDRIRAAEAVRAEAELNTRPDIALSAAYAHRSEFPDLASVSVGINLPIFSGSKQRPERREYAAAVLQREAEELELLNETFAALTEARAAAYRALDLERLYATSVLPQARAAVEAALSGYQVGEADFMTLLGAQTTLNRFEIERLRLTADHHIAVARIEALLGGDLEESER